MATERVMIFDWNLNDFTRDPVEAWFFQPHPDLRLAITAYYFLRMPPGGAVDIMHPDWFNFRFFVDGRGRMRMPGMEWMDAPAAAVVGPFSRAPLIDISGFVAAAGLTPYGWSHLVGLPASRFADRALPVEDALGTAGNELFAKLASNASIDIMRDEMDRFFRQRLEARPRPKPLIAKAHGKLMCPQVRTVEQWARSLDVSTRQLERISLAVFGMSPKRLLRRQRFLRTLAALRGAPRGTWAGLIDDQYADQAQFSREFKFFMGLTPQTYFSRPSAIMQPAADARKQAIGEPAQGLHPSPSFDAPKGEREENRGTHS